MIGSREKGQIRLDWKSPLSADSEAALLLLNEAGLCGRRVSPGGSYELESLWVGGGAGAKEM